MSKRRTKAADEGAERARAIAEVAAAEMRAADDLDELRAPPRPGKVHPAHEMGFVVPTSDDDVRHHPHHPNEPAGTGMHPDPDAADAAADLAGDLGAQFLEGATYGEDVSQRAAEDAELAESEVPFVLETEEEIEPLLDTPGAQRPRRARKKRAA